VRLIILFLVACSFDLAPAVEKISYNRDIRPILSDTCFRCHGPDKNNIKGKLRLDDREAALKREAIIPGNPADSELVKRIHASDPDDVMPPPDSVRQLTTAQKQIIERWITEGATYEPHWAYIPPKRSALPTLSDKTWSANPIDTFIRARLDAEKIIPSPEADRPALLRRLSLDLIGLPPTSAEVDAFVNDTSADAYDKQVARLLASPHFGERMAVPWLDAVRFADTVGFHGDQNLNIFPYRDWVIDAFNRNLPFDRFTAEQLAGDLLPDANDRTRTASGFNRLNMVTREGGAQPKEYLAKYAADRVRTLGGAWLGSTLACCECHDHKYDPWGIKDFYQLAAFFADVKQWGVYADHPYSKNPDLPGFSNEHPFPPEIAVESPYLKLREASLRRERDQLTTGRAAKFDKLVKTWQSDITTFLLASPSGWRADDVASPTDNNAGYKVTDSTVTISAERNKNVTLRLMPKPGRLASIRLDLALINNGSASITPDTDVLVDLRIAYKPVDGDKTHPVNSRMSGATEMMPDYIEGTEALGVHTGWNLSPDMLTKDQSAVWVLERPLTISQGDIVELRFVKNKLAGMKVSYSPLVPPNLNRPTFDDAFLRQITQPTVDAQVDAQVAYHWLAGTAADQDAFDQLIELDRKIAACRGGMTMTAVTEAWEPTTVRVLPRGNWLDESGEVVQPVAPSFLHQITAEGNRRLNRLDLAKWLTDSENPLTSRVFVNRLWAQFMGVGLSVTVEDFGLQGEIPSHPDLLDWLAVEFRENNWNVKKMVTLIVTSKTYKQSAVQRPEVLAKDPGNRLRAMQSVRRLDAEFVRDNALAISGLLAPELGGPSVKPYQPPGYYANLQFPNRDYFPETDRNQYRRGVYMHWQRTFLHPMLANFDAPARDECAVFRMQANSPQQALTLLNDPTFVEASRSWAAKLIADGGDDAAKITRAFRAALSRSATAEESAGLLTLLAKSRTLYTAQPQQASALLRTGLAPLPPEDQRSEVAAWTQVCRVILNLHETISRL
jgi:hypothetical protein